MIAPTTFIPAQPAMTPAVDEPGTLCQQFMVIATWLSQPDDARLDPETWEAIRRLWIPHAARGAR